MTEPVISIGPDADKFRDPVTGAVLDASDLGQTISTFTAHRSPLGLVFDRAGALAAPYIGHGFMLSFTPGDPNGTNVAGPFFDASQDLVDLELTRLGDTNYQARVTTIVSGFSTPVDSEIITNQIYVLEYGANGGLWEITFPPALVLSMPARLADGSFQFMVSGAVSGQSYQPQFSSDLTNWSGLTNITAGSSSLVFTDTTPGTGARFYRVKRL